MYIIVIDKHSNMQTYIDNNVVEVHCYTLQCR